MLTIRGRKIPSWVFDLYQSTATGVVSDTQAGLPFWKNPKILGLSLFLAVVVAFLISRGNPLKIFRPVGALSAASSGQNSTAPSGAAGGGVPGRAVSDPFDILKGKTIWLVGVQSYRTEQELSEYLLFELQAQDETTGVIITSDTLSRLGYSITRLNRNLVSVKKDGNEYFIRSRGVQSEKKDIL